MYISGIDNETWLQHAWQNRLQSLFLLVVMACFLALLGWLLWGRDGVVILVSTGLAAVLLNASISPRMVMLLYGASPVRPDQAPALWKALALLSERAELPVTPQLYYVPSQMLNAFAVGSRKHSAIAVTDGLVRQLDLRELVGVVAHEVSHVRNNDLWVMGLADMFSRTTSMLSLIGQFLLLLNLPLILLSQVVVNWFAILLLIFAPNLSALAQLALARTREFNADLNAARLTGDPDGLASALVKIERAQGGWLERIFMPNRRVPVPSLLRTHPETRERVRRLMQLKPDLKGADLLFADASKSDRLAAFGKPVSRPPRQHIGGLWH